MPAERASERVHDAHSQAVFDFIILFAFSISILTILSNDFRLTILSILFPSFSLRGIVMHSLNSVATVMLTMLIMRCELYSLLLSPLSLKRLFLYRHGKSLNGYRLSVQVDLIYLLSLITSHQKTPSTPSYSKWAKNPPSAIWRFDGKRSPPRRSSRRDRRSRSRSRSPRRRDDDRDEPRKDRDRDDKDRDRDKDKDRDDDRRRDRDRDDDDDRRRRRSRSRERRRRSRTRSRSRGRDDREKRDVEDRDRDRDRDVVIDDRNGDPKDDKAVSPS